MKIAFKYLLLTVFLISIVFTLLTYNSDEPYKTLFSIITGTGFSIVISMIFQAVSSEEQNEMIKKIALDAQGVSEVPEMFKNLKWLMVGTKKPGRNGEKIIEWSTITLNRKGGSDGNFINYSLETKNIEGKLVEYNLTIIGTRGCKIGLVTKDDETSSVIIFETHVTNAGVYFGPAYLTDWFGDRNLTLAIAGTSLITNIGDLSDEAKCGFEEWFNKPNWEVKKIFDLFKDLAHKKKA